MPRLKVIRKIYNPPLMKGYKPFGIKNLETRIIKINFDEFESLKYMNYEDISQKEAALKMGVSRPTFTRIYNSALKKLTRSLVDGCTIEFDGGEVYCADEWYKCSRCYKIFNNQTNHVKCKKCNFFNNTELVKLI